MRVHDYKYIYWDEMGRGVSARVNVNDTTWISDYLQDYACNQDEIVN